MYICMCNPFSDRQVKQYLDEKDDKATVGEVYKVCSDGEAPQCCSCIDTLKDIVLEHNRI